MMTKVSNYIKFMQEMLKKEFGNKYKAPFQIEDKKIQKDFFKKVKQEYAKHKKKSHTVHMEKMDINSVKEYFKHYIETLDIKDIDIVFHLDRFDLDMWAHGKDNKHYYAIEASFPLEDKGQVSLEVYESKEEEKVKVKVENYNTFKEAIKEIKEFENK